MAAVAAWLNSNYRITTSRQFDPEGHHAYRIYLPK
jgi:hypothetical protein